MCFMETNRLWIKYRSTVIRFLSCIRVPQNKFVSIAKSFKYDY